MVPVLSFFGSDKRVVLINEVVNEFLKRGKRVGVIRERRGELLGKELQAEVEVCGEFVRAFQRIEEDFKHLLGRFFYGCDLVLAEGFKDISWIPKVWVAEVGTSLPEVVNLVAVVSEEGAKFGELAVFSPAEVEGLVYWIETEVLSGFWARNTAMLFVNGRFIPMKRYVQETLAGIIEGFVSRLKMTEGARFVEISVRLDIENFRGKGYPQGEGEVVVCPGCQLKQGPGKNYHEV